MLTLQGNLLPAVGDVLVLGCAFAFALHIVGLGVWSPGRPAAALATVQLATSALLHAAGGAAEALATDGPYTWLPGGTYVWTALLFTAIFASAFAFSVQTAAQKVLAPTRTAVILTMEPVFAALTEVVGVPLLTSFGVTGLVAATVGPREAMGAALILAAMLWSELRTGEPPDALAAHETGTLAQPSSVETGSGTNRSASSPTAVHPRTSSSDTARSS
jgi:drug/metabolite transporter (DMT)-like permease